MKKTFIFIFFIVTFFNTIAIDCVYLDKIVKFHPVMIFYNPIIERFYKTFIDAYPKSRLEKLLGKEIIKKVKSFNYSKFLEDKKLFEKRISEIESIIRELDRKYFEAEFNWHKAISDNNMKQVIFFKNQMDKIKKDIERFKEKKANEIEKLNDELYISKELSNKILKRIMTNIFRFISYLEKKENIKIIFLNRYSSYDENKNWVSETDSIKPFPQKFLTFIKTENDKTFELEGDYPTYTQGYDLTLNLRWRQKEAENLKSFSELILEKYGKVKDHSKEVLKYFYLIYGKKKSNFIKFLQNWINN